MIKAFIVDDEEHALNILELFLVKTGKVQVIGRSSNAFDAIAAFGHMLPDVWFLDIDMPEMNGIELADRIRMKYPNAEIVYVTAYNQYAVKAFEHAALDYLLKPLEMNRLGITIDRLSKRLEGSRPLSDGDDKQLPVKLNIRMLGTLQVFTESGASLKWRTTKEKELLAFLALQGFVPVHRDRILDKLWPDDPYQNAKVYFHTCVSLLRKHFKELGVSRVLNYENEKYMLDAGQVEVDVEQFKRGLKRWKNEEEAPLEELEQLMELYRFNFLQDEDYPWAVQESIQMEKMAMQWFVWLVNLYIEKGDFYKAIETAERAIQLSPCEEPLYRLLMQAYVKLGNHAQVQRVYFLLVERLAELRIRPADATIQLYKQIKEIKTPHE